MAKVKPINIDMKGLEEASKPSAPSFDTTRLQDRAAEVANLSATRAKEMGDRREKLPSKGSSSGGGESFSKAFARAREKGEKTFKWGTGTYGTKMKGETSSAKPAKPAASPYSASTSTKDIARNTKTDNSQMSNAQNRKFMSDNERGYEETAARKLMNPISRVARALGTEITAPTISSSRDAPKAAAPKAAASKPTGFSVDTKALAKATTDSLSAAASRAVPRTGYSNAPKSSSGTGYGSFKK